MSSSILKHIEEVKAVATAIAEWNDLVSVEEIAEKTRKSTRMVKDILKEKKLTHVSKIGKSYMYSKRELLEAIKT